MKFSKKNGDFLEMYIKDYEFPNLEPYEYEEYDANWLDITIKAKDGKYEWESTAPCLLTWEGKQLLDFLRAIAEDRDYDKLYFEGPELSFSAVNKDDGNCIISCGLWLDMHPFSYEDDVDPYFMDFELTKVELAKEVDDFAFELSKFPHR